MALASSERLEAAYQTALAALLKERTPEGHWVGELSTSALSTATAVMALSLVEQHGGVSHREIVERGLRWLVEHQNTDGGWGDTTKSFSNISTTMLCRSAFYLTKSSEVHHSTVERAEVWLRAGYGPEAKWPEAIRQRYGKDRTFATPILTTCALAGLVSWNEVPPLPFELAVLPQSWFRFVKLHVVSYALPALIAIGQCVHQHRRSWNPFTRFTRWASRSRTLNVLRAIQPSSGGYLEATPLTSFVTLSLASIGHASHPVAADGVRFLVNSVLPDGGWAIDTNLATWVTTLSINALATAGELHSLDCLEAVRDWIVRQQYRERHPFTGADPGGWAWTDLPGGVPDADDTPGAIIALHHLEAALGSPTVSPSASWHPIPSGFAWLFGLQNRDGGWPTFCRGWGHLPFDRSGSDLTAHAIRAVASFVGGTTAGRFSKREIRTVTLRASDSAVSRPIFFHAQLQLPAALAYLARMQRPDGSWLPLWFGNQHAPDDENPTYGTARVLAAYRDLEMLDVEPARKGIAWLLANQNPDGGWGGGLGTPSSLEETALAVEVLLATPAPDAIESGLAWLVDCVEAGGLHDPTPIGFYFAKLWYYEKLYPIIFAVAALGRARITLR